MEHTDRVAVIATRLAGTDRRALSQAWYSALHVAAHGASGRSRAPVQRSVRAAARSAATPQSPAPRSAVRSAPAAWAAVRAAATPKAAPAAERRAAPSELTRRIERGVRAQGTRPGVGSFAVRDEGGRVHVVVRTAAGVTRVIAVCEPALRARVERALAQARFTLAGMGVRTEAAG